MSRVRPAPVASMVLDSSEQQLPASFSPCQVCHKNDALPFILFKIKYKSLYSGALTLKSYRLQKNKT